MIKIITGMPGHGMSLERPSDRWSKTNKFLNAQADMFRSEHNRAVIERYPHYPLH